MTLKNKSLRKLPRRGFLKVTAEFSLASAGMISAANALEKKPASKKSGRWLKMGWLATGR